MEMRPTNSLFLSSIHALFGLPCFPFALPWALCACMSAFRMRLSPAVACRIKPARLPPSRSRDGEPSDLGAQRTSSYPRGAEATGGARSTDPTLVRGHALRRLVPAMYQVKHAGVWVV